METSLSNKIREYVQKADNAPGLGMRPIKSTGVARLSVMK